MAINERTIETLIDAVRKVSNSPDLDEVPLLAEIAGGVELEVMVGDEPVEGREHGEGVGEEEGDDGAALAVAEVGEGDAAEHAGDAVDEDEAQREQAERAAGQRRGGAREPGRIEGHARVVVISRAPRGTWGAWW